MGFFCSIKMGIIIPILQGLCSLLECEPKTRAKLSECWWTRQGGGKESRERAQHEQRPENINCISLLPGYNPSIHHSRGGSDPGVLVLKCDPFLAIQLGEFVGKI